MLCVSMKQFCRNIRVDFYSLGIMGINTAAVKVALTEAAVICFGARGGGSLPHKDRAGI